MKLDKKAKGDLIALVVVVLSVAIFALISKGAKFINPVAVGGVSLVIQFLVAIPMVVKRYYQVNRVTAGFSRFIPLWNETMVFEPSIAILSLISWAVLALSIGSIFISPVILADTFSEAVALNWGDNAMRVTVGLLVVNFVIRGMGYIKFIHAVNALAEECYSSKKSKANSLVSVLLCITAFIPVAQIIPLFYQMDTLLSFDINKFKASDIRSEEQKIIER